MLISNNISSLSTETYSYYYQKDIELNNIISYLSESTGEVIEIYNDFIYQEKAFDYKELPFRTFIYNNSKKIENKNKNEIKCTSKVGKKCNKL